LEADPWRTLDAEKTVVEVSKAGPGRDIREGQEGGAPANSAGSKVCHRKVRQGAYAHFVGGQHEAPWVHNGAG